MTIVMHYFPLNIMILISCNENGLPTHPKMKYWKEGTDCCSWDGVTCDPVTGHVIGLDLSCNRLYGNILSDSSLFLLPQLQWLNLAHNDFNDSEISSNFAKFPSLTHLNFSYSHFSGQVLCEISRLSKLVSLDLSTDYYSVGELELEGPVMEELVQNMTELEELILDRVNMSSVQFRSLANISSSLTSLSLSSCELCGSFPENIFCLPDLRMIKLDGNSALTGSFSKVNWSSSLRFLDVSETSFSGQLPDSIGDLKFLEYLDIRYCKFIDLSSNNFSGHIPSSLSNIEQLRELELWKNNFIGEIPYIFSNLTQLSWLSLSNNRLSGPIPSSVVSGLRNLVSINFDENSLDGAIPFGLFTLPLLESVDLSGNKLTDIDLGNNRLHGPIPSSIFEFENLIGLDLSSNNFSGTIDLYRFGQLKKLEHLYLSHNSLSLNNTIKANSSFPPLIGLGLSSCNVNEFPEVLLAAESIEMLDLSDNKIHGHIPNWLFHIGFLYHLNLSHNFLTGIERQQRNSSMLKLLDLHSNLLQGQLPFPSGGLIFFSISHNKFTGGITSSFCNLTQIQYLDFSDNSLYGTLPQCLGNSRTISVMDLSTNNFHGSIPQTFAEGNQLVSLHLSGNQFEGPLPSSLVVCRNLQLLDVGNNRINDTFPHWLGTIPELQVLILRSNRFHGPIGTCKSRFSFSKLRILDLSHNGFTGLLPTTFFKNMKAEMKYMDDGNSYYQDSVMVTMKGVDFKMERILTIFTSMDLSTNKFGGRIPDVIGKLNSLIVLNFSRNNLVGHIPLSVENLTAIESLDLSSNKLDGKIPLQLTSLTFLSVLNLLYNQLEEQDTWSWFDWKITTMGYGSGLVIGLSMGYIVFSTGKPWWLVSMVERKVINLTGRNKRRRN
ncbi:hypothetical protein ACOSP7_030232 [Xanthoceras sorbifolium]